MGHREGGPALGQTFFTCVLVLEQRALTVTLREAFNSGLTGRGSAKGGG